MKEILSFSRFKYFLQKIPSPSAAPQFVYIFVNIPVPVKNAGRAFGRISFAGSARGFLALVTTGSFFGFIQSGGFVSGAIAHLYGDLGHCPRIKKRMNLEICAFQSLLCPNFAVENVPDLRSG